MHNGRKKCHEWKAKGIAGIREKFQIRITAIGLIDISQWIRRFILRQVSMEEI